MYLNPQTERYLRRDDERPHWEGMNVQEARALAQQWHLEHAVFSPATAELRRQVQSLDVVAPGRDHDVPIRLYQPAAPAERLLPVVVFIHGGGYVIGDLETHDELCRELAARIPAVVAAVDYRLAPEHRYPAAVRDCVQATRWIAQEAARFGADGTRLAVAGDSAGGNLATVVARTARDEAGPEIRLQLLIYPITDNTRGLDDSDSARRYGKGFELTLEDLHWFQEQYFEDQENARADPDASPLLTANLAGTAPALILVAELDPIADSAEQYAAALAAAGVPVRVERFPGLMHAFVTMGSFFDAAFDAADRFVEALARALG